MDNEMVVLEAQINNEDKCESLSDFLVNDIDYILTCEMAESGMLKDMNK